MNVALALSLKGNQIKRRNEIASFLNGAHKIPRPPFVGGGFTCKWLLMKVKEVRSWPNQMKVCGSPKSEDTSLCLPHSSLTSWPHWEKWVEREDAPKRARGTPLQKCAF